MENCENTNYLYEFSVPMPFSKDSMRRITEINKKLSKTRITSVYNCIPVESEDFTFFEQPRLSEFPEISSLDELFEIATIGKDAGIDFIYICNSPGEKTEEEMMMACDKMDNLISKMKEYGFNKIRVTNLQLIEYLLVNHPDIHVLTSTSQEYSTAQEYLQMLKTFPNIKEILPSWDMNKNIRFIKTLNDTIDQDIEIMVNEGCLSGCPFRTQHNSYLAKSNKYYQHLIPESAQPLLDKSFYLSLCGNIFDNHLWRTVCLSNIIYPWEIDKYAQVTGIRKFKLVGRNCSSFRTGDYISIYANFLLAIEKPEILDEESIAITNHYILDTPCFQDIKIKDVKELLPSLDFFIETNPDCKNICGEECFYCYAKARQLQERFPIQPRY